MRERIQSILTNLDAVGEDLLALFDDIWLNIDHNDAEAMEAGVALKKQYNAKLAAFGQLSSEIEALLDEWAGGPAEKAPLQPPKATRSIKQERDRIIHELDRLKPHGISEDFRFKRPCGMIPYFFPVG